MNTSEKFETWFGWIIFKLDFIGESLLFLIAGFGGFICLLYLFVFYGIRCLPGLRSQTGNSLIIILLCARTIACSFHFEVSLYPIP